MISNFYELFEKIKTNILKTIVKRPLFNIYNLQFNIQVNLKLLKHTLDNVIFSNNSS